MNKTMKLVFIIVLTAVISSGLTLTWMQPETVVREKVVGQNPEFSKLYDTYSKLEQKYYLKTDKQKMIDGAITGMVQSLGDPYSTYMSAEDSKGFNETISSSFEGIGAELQEIEGQVMIVSPIKGSPAEKAGLKPKDKIVKVNGKSVKGKTVNDTVALIRGKKGTSVKVGIERGGSQELEFSITRDEIPIETVYSSVTKEKIGKIQITTFSERTAADFSKAVKDLEAKQVKGIVIDLRQNPGGLMDEAIRMSEMFIPEGKNILQVENKDGSREAYRSENKNPVTIPSVVLVDEGTASAGEIMAAALNESADIPLIGEKTFGKGTIQTAESYKDGSSVKFTIAKWLTPGGTWVHKKGIEPSEKVSLPDYAGLPFIDPSKTLKSGDASKEVKTAQAFLNALGYKVPENGLFDPGMKEAVMKYQQDHDLKPTGVIEKDTSISMLTSLQDKIKKNDTQMNRAIQDLNK
ncbi:PDZ domain-containing protein [Bacillus sp. FJAT-42376]|uniref:S41 family peptidase n=1 Tax=Bacillus sp. FJAT-42376 TaxID=2014076 RepID=UPI000F4D6BF5|nr:S41 family peptidase [Bacillus sp. FJAT-42376]AZB43195.1 PDZ domain-containing protein [Bacillus sp. FJAT-42376]